MYDKIKVIGISSLMELNTHKNEMLFGNFPGNPVIKTQHFQRGWGSILVGKNKDPVATPKLKKRKGKEMPSMLPLSRRISHGIEKLSL